MICYRGLFLRCSFIAAANAIKKSVCRYCMHQHLKAIEGRVRTRLASPTVPTCPLSLCFAISACSWQIDRVSAYCPLLLFADDDATRMRALIALAESPQNNLSIRTREIECANPQRGRPPTSLGLREVCPIPRWLSSPSSGPPAHRTAISRTAAADTQHSARQLRV